MVNLNLKKQTLNHQRIHHGCLKQALKRSGLQKYRGCSRGEGGNTVPAIEIKVTSSGSLAGKEMLTPTGEQGIAMPHVQDWVTAKLKAKTPVKDVSAMVLVKGIKQWAVFEEKSGSKKIRTVFKIT